MSAAGDDVRKRMADPFSLGGFIPDRDRNGIKYCNIEFGTGKVTPKMRSEDLDANMSKISEDKRLGPDILARRDSLVGTGQFSTIFADQTSGGRCLSEPWEGPITATERLQQGAPLRECECP